MNRCWELFVPAPISSIVSILPISLACVLILMSCIPDIGDIQARMDPIKHKILILSGKGGVGKSTFTAHLAYGLATNEETQV